MVVEEDAAAEFTCNDGKCVSMERRCDQLPDCEDGSDEKGCRLFFLGESYNKVVSPFRRVSYLNKNNCACLNRCEYETDASYGH